MRSAAAQAVNRRALLASPANRAADTHLRGREDWRAVHRQIVTLRAPVPG